jgi:hypothetical protein
MFDDKWKRKLIVDGWILRNERDNNKKKRRRRRNRNEM